MPVSRSSRASKRKASRKVRRTRRQRGGAPPPTDIFFLQKGSTPLTGMFTADKAYTVTAGGNGSLQLCVKPVSGLTLPSIAKIEIFPMYNGEYTTTPFSKAPLTTGASARGAVVFFETPGSGTTSTRLSFPTASTVKELRIRGMTGANTLNGTIGQANAGKTLDANGKVPEGGSSPANVKVTITWV
jgi:hypothetical protein